MLRHGHLGTEHLLLGLLREQQGVAALVLESRGLTLEQARGEIVRMVTSDEVPPFAQISFTSGAKKALELALRESQSLGDGSIDTEHILLGVIDEQEGVTARILLGVSADGARVRNEVVRALTSPEGRARKARPGLRRTRDIESWLGGLGPALQQLAAEIRSVVGREPDEGDLLLALACASDTLAGRALGELGVGLDELRGSIERLRGQTSSSSPELTQRIEEARAAKEKAIEARDYPSAARFRDQERELAEQAGMSVGVQPEELHAMRRYLRIAGPSE